MLFTCVCVCVCVCLSVCLSLSVCVAPSNLLFISIPRVLRVITRLGNVLAEKLVIFRYSLALAQPSPFIATVALRPLTLALLLMNVCKYVYVLYVYM